MPKLKDRITVAVTEAGSDPVKRKIVVEIEAGASLLTVSDLLAHEEAIEALPQRLKRINKTAITEYIQSGKTLLKTAAQAANPGIGKTPKPAKRAPSQEQS
ncbi:MAG TPA: hypothetical protein PLP17_16210 [Oligoflexia bacterium]|nr:hypothetical protein [Oligoflexia bacterium]